MNVLSKDELAPTKFENCLLAPMKFGDLLTVAPSSFVTYLASYVSTHELKFLTQALTFIATNRLLATEFLEFSLSVLHKYQIGSNFLRVCNHLV